MTHQEFQSICKEVNVNPSTAFNSIPVKVALNNDLRKHIRTSEELTRMDKGLPLPSERGDLLRKVLKEFKSLNTLTEFKNFTGIL